MGFQIFIIEADEIWCELKYVLSSDTATVYTSSSYFLDLKE